MPTPTSDAQFPPIPSAHNETSPSFDSLHDEGDTRPSQKIASPPTSGWSAYLAHLFLGIGLTAIAMLFGLVFWRLGHLPRSSQPVVKHRDSPSVPPAELQPDMVIDATTGLREPIKDTALPLVDSPQEMQRQKTRPKAPLLAAPPRLPAPPTPDQIFEQRLLMSEDDLLRDLAAVPELRLLSDSEVRKVRQVERTAQANVSRVARDNKRAAEAIRRVNHMRVRFQFPTSEIIAEQDQIAYNTSLRLHQQMRRDALHAGLDLQLGPTSKLAPDTASEMAELSKALRNLGFVNVPGLDFMNRFASAALARSADSGSGKTKSFQRWCDQHHLEKYKGTMPTLVQMLQIENEATRLLLVRELTRITRKGSTTQLAGRAILDLSPQVRQAAIAGLAGRPASEYVPILLRGLRYPWPPVADHAAVALRTLKPVEAAAPLVDLLDLPSPSAPILDAATNEYIVRELIRLNHLRNCLLCHAPSLNAEDGLVRGLVPTPGSALPRPISARTGGYYEGLDAVDFVRADITFLHQDFSVTLSDRTAMPWPDEQRFDFVTRWRTLTPAERADIPASPIEYPQRDAVLYALRGLTGKDGGISSVRWRELLGFTTHTPKIDKKSPALERIAISPNEMDRPR